MHAVNTCGTTKKKGKKNGIMCLMYRNEALELQDIMRLHQKRGNLASASPFHHRGIKHRPENIDSGLKATEKEHEK